jgi:hypothetical protein
MENLDDLLIIPFNLHNVSDSDWRLTESTDEYIPLPSRETYHLDLTRLLGLCALWAVDQQLGALTVISPFKIYPLIPFLFWSIFSCQILGV